MTENCLITSNKTCDGGKSGDCFSFRVIASKAVVLFMVEVELSLGTASF